MRRDARALVELIVVAVLGAVVIAGVVFAGLLALDEKPIPAEFVGIVGAALGGLTALLVSLRGGTEPAAQVSTTTTTVSAADSVPVVVDPITVQPPPVP